MYFTKCKNTFILFLKNAHTVYTSLLLFARLSHLIQAHSPIYVLFIFMFSLVTFLEESGHELSVVLIQI